MVLDGELRVLVDGFMVVLKPFQRIFLSTGSKKFFPKENESSNLFGSNLDPYEVDSLWTRTYVALGRTTKTSSFLLTLGLERPSRRVSPTKTDVFSSLFSKNKNLGRAPHFLTSKHIQSLLASFSQWKMWKTKQNALGKLKSQ